MVYATKMIGEKTNDFIIVGSTMDDALVWDRISDLPWEILDNILGRLPIENAVATTILSRKWKDKWVDISKLVFLDYSREQTHAHFIRRVYSVLLSHRGTIEKFGLTIRGSESFLSYSDFNTWISFLRKHDIKELTFNFPKIRTLPSSLLSCEKLRHLSLTNCSLSLPENVLGLRHLVSLHLASRWQHTDEELEKMINNLTNLEKLVLVDTGFNRLTICAPSLRYLSFLEGAFGDVYLKDCLHLEYASFKMVCEAKGTSHSLVQPPNWLSCLRSLVMTGHFLKFLAERGNWSGVSIDCHNLEVLELDEVNFNDPDEMTVALSILRSSSNLNKLLINGIGLYEGGYNIIFTEVQSQGISECFFNKLRLVRITISRRYSELLNDQVINPEEEDKRFPHFIRLILAGSPILEKMQVHYNYLEYCDMWFVRKLLLCERASSLLKLTYKSTKL